MCDKSKFCNKFFLKPRNIPDRWEHDMFEGDGHPGRGRSSLNRRRTEPPKMENRDCTKLIINNLDFAVTDDDIEVEFVHKQFLLLSIFVAKKIFFSLLKIVVLFNFCH